MQTIRRGAIITTGFGYDATTDITGFRYHRAIDWGRSGDQHNYCPVNAKKALIEYNNPDFGDLVRLICDGYEIRIAHNIDFNSNFLVLVKTCKPIPEGMTISRIGQTGTATGPHTHAEVISIGRRNPIWDEIYLSKGIVPECYYTDGMIDNHEKSTEIRAWMKKMGCTKLGQQECKCWDRRNNCESIWYNPDLLGY